MDAFSLRKVPWLGAPLAALVSAWRRRHGEAPGKTIVYYDGDCGICNSFVQRVLRAGVPEDVYFASQQGALWSALLENHPELRNLDAVVITIGEPPHQQILTRSEAVFWLMSQLEGAYAIGFAAMLVPLPLLNIGYRLVASNRKTLSAAIGHAQCMLPTPEMRRHFLD